MELLKSYLTSYLPDAKGLSRNTIISYKYTFRLLLEFMNSCRGIAADQISFDMLDYQTLAEFLLWLEKERNCSASTKNQRLSALLSFSKYAQNRDFEAALVFRSSVIKIPVKKASHKTRTTFTTDEVAKLLSLPDEKSSIGLRDKVLLSFMYASGARAQEVCDLTVGDISFSDNHTSVVLHGKGGKSRRISIPSQCGNMLKKYIDIRRLSKKYGRHVFSSQNHEKMSVSCIEEVFKKYVLLAREMYPDMFKGTSYPPHSMRHSTACHMLEAGIPIMVIKNFLGHASVQTTQIYAELTQDEVNKKLIDWNRKWFHNEEIPKDAGNAIPDFLRV